MANEAHPKLYIFCIGGTGARIMKALTFLLATGVDIKASQVIPIIIDPDRKNGDVERTIEILKKYQYIRKQLEFTNNEFFKTEIKTLASLEADSQKGHNLKITDGFKFNIDGTKDGKFGDFVKKENLDIANKALVEALFSEQNLTAELSVGFKGNPHMGSIVLNQFKDNDEFKFFASTFNEKDRIFIVSSIFGGTGAAGFPLLVKNLREAKEGLSNHIRLRKAPIGALSVMPYFGVLPDENSEIDESTFISKTKAALRYYERNLTGDNNKSLNALYYLADTVKSGYKNSEGAAGQKNDAHFIELIGALSIIDFMTIPDDKLENKKISPVDERYQAKEPLYREYGINGNVKELTFKNLGKKSRQTVIIPMTQYTYACKYWKDHIHTAVERGQTWTKGQIEIGTVFLNDDFFKEDLQQFNDRYLEWLMEMARNTREFHPFDINVNDKLLHTMVRDYEQKKVNFIKGSKWNYYDFDSYLNTAEKKLGELRTNEKFMAIFSMGTKELVTEKLSIEQL